MPNPRDYAEKRAAQLALSPFPDAPPNWEPEVIKSESSSQSKPGPKTHEGKQRSALNALRHGLTGRIVLMPGEDLQLYLSFSRKFTEALNPKGVIESQFAQNAADAQWRLNRLKSIEDLMLALGQVEPLPSCTMDPIIDDALETGQAFRTYSRAFANLSIYEHRILRAMEKAIAQLKALQKEREAKELQTLEDALMMKQFDEMEGRVYDPQPDGFVFSAAELDAELTRRQRFAAAKLAQSHGFNPQTYRKEVFRQALPEAA